MSRVFLSEDTTLEREVVVKVLSPDLVDELRVERFRQEVLQTARLQHPTIVPLLEVGAIDDGAGRRVPYYIMPYVRGESLRSRLRHEGRLSTGLAIRILRGVLDALAHAHAHGVVHRDIKPENIFLSGTTAVLADFGIAKAIAGPGSNDSKTADGIAVGTPSYMAPEQLVGQGQIDHRADLYAVGVVAYEILTGELPFGGSTRTLAEKLALQARGELTSIRGVRPDVPAELAAVIESCLSWDVKGRPESAQQALRVLESIPITPTTDTYKVPGWSPIPRMGRRGKRATVAALAVGVLVVGALFNPLGDGDAGRTPRKLAVLYPELGNGGGERTLNEQLFRTLVATMNPISGLRLVGQVTVPQMVKQGFTSQQIGDSLRAQGADSALVFRARPRTDGGYMLSLELQQLGAGRNSELLAGPLLLGSLDGLSPDSVRAIVGMLAGQVVAKLRLSSAIRTVPESQIIDAWLAWSRGREAYARRSPEGLATAIKYFERAIELDTMYAQAHAELAQTLALSLFYKYRRAEPPYEVAARALRLANRAIQLQPNFADGYLARGYLGNVAGAPADFVEKNYTDVQRLPSTNPYSQVWLVGLLAAKGQFEEALAKLEQEVRLDPRSPAQRIATALYALPAKRFLVTVRDAAAAQAMGSNIPFASQLELIGRLQLGGRAVDECVNVKAGPYLGLRSLCLERVGRHAESRAAVDALFAMITDKAPIDSTFDLSLYVIEMSTYYAARRERDSARQWLRQGMLESPAAIDVRLIRSGYFDDELITFGDSLRHEAWKRVVQMAERADREGRAVR